MNRIFFHALGRAALGLWVALAGVLLVSTPAAAQATADVVFLSTAPVTAGPDPDLGNIQGASDVFQASATTNGLTYFSNLGALSGTGDLSAYMGANTRVLVLVGVYNAISDEALSQLSTILQTSPGMEVIAFIDGCTQCGDASMATASLNLKNFLSQVINPIAPGAWSIGVGTTIYGGVAPGIPVQINPYSTYYTQFSGLSTFYGNYFAALLNVPNDHALYYIPAAGSAPTAAATTINNALGLFIAQTESNSGKGSCVFLAGDDNLWFGTQGAAIAQTFLDAALQPNGACAIPPVVQIAKTASSAGNLMAGVPVTYTITVTNTSATTLGGKGAASNVTVADPVPDPVLSATFAWTCAGTGGAVCPNASGSGALNEHIASLPAGAVLTYTISAVPTTSAGHTVTNIATVTGSDLVCADGSAKPCEARVSNPYTAADMQAAGAASVLATVGTQVTVTTTCTNAGPDAAVNATCQVTVSGPASGVSTTCSPATNPSLALHGVITCQTRLTPTGGAGSIAVVTKAGSDTSDLNMANNTHTTSVPVIGGRIGPTGDAASIPTLGQMALAWLALLLAAGAAPALRRRAKVGATR